MSKNKPSNYWTKQKCLDISLQCNSKKEFKKSDYGAYQAAYRNGWLDECCKHMI